MSTEVNILVTREIDLTTRQKEEIHNLQKMCFSDQVTTEEVEEDFVRPSVARVLAYHRNSLVACADIFMRSVNYSGDSMLLGGLSPCTDVSFRGQGLGTQLCRTAMQFLEDLGCDIVFLSVDTSHATHPLYERLGFKMLSGPFIFVNSKGELKESDGGMIAPLRSRQWFERVLKGDVQFSLAPEPGYW